MKWALYWISCPPPPRIIPPEDSVYLLYFDVFSSLVKITYEKTSLKALSTNRKSPERGRIFISYRIINALKKEQVIEGPRSASVASQGPSSSCQGAQPREVRCGLPTGMCRSPTHTPPTHPPHPHPSSQAQPAAQAAPGWPPVRKAGILGTHKRKRNECLLGFLLCSTSLNIRCRIFLSGQKSPLMPSFQRKSPRPRRPVVPALRSRALASVAQITALFPLRPPLSSSCSS